MSVTQSGRALRNCLEHRLGIRWRSAYRLEHIACCCLILEGLSRVASACLHLFEKARVFNRDHGLVRKGIDELDLAFGERAHFAAPNYDHANGLACVEQGYGEL